MSYDLEVWSVRPPDLPEALPNSTDWQPERTGWQRRGRGWQIVVGMTDDVWPEDVPGDVAVRLPGIAHLTQLNLEPIHAPKSAHTLLRRTAQDIARSGHGLIHDRQTDSLETPTGVKRFAAAPREQTFSRLCMTWWFLDGPLSSPEGVSTLLSMLEARLPEALPRRYGLYEPPQYSFDEGGRVAFEHFLIEHLDDLVVWYPRRPVASVSLAACPGQGLTERGFKACRLCLEVEVEALRVPGWETELRVLWHTVSKLVRPFYGDVRTLHGALRGRGTYAFGPETELHPVSGPWWGGVPRKLGHAVVAGREYQSVWPQLALHADAQSDLLFLSVPQWSGRRSVNTIVGAPPEDISQQTGVSRFGSVIPERYPPVWPLPGPYGP